jgi:hypothetical protein
MTDWSGMATLIGALNTIILPVILWRIKRREILLERTLEKRDSDLKAHIQANDRSRKDSQAKLNRTYSYIFGYLWSLQHSLDAERICIVQPHPLNDRQYVSVTFEILHPGRDVSPPQQNFQCRSIAEWGTTVKKWTDSEFIIYRDINDIKDLKLYSEAHRRGCKTAVFYRLTDAAGYWTGTLALDFTHEQPTGMQFIKGEVQKYGTLIADILPEYNPITPS